MYAVTGTNDIDYMVLISFDDDDLRLCHSLFNKSVHQRLEWEFRCSNETSLTNMMAKKGLYLWVYHVDRYMVRLCFELWENNTKLIRVTKSLIDTVMLTYLFSMRSTLTLLKLSIEGGRDVEGLIPKST